MKKLLVLFVMLSVVEGLLVQVVAGQTNIYHPFPTDNAYWSVAYGYDDMWGTECTHTTHYGIIGDTTIEGNIYSKFYASGDTTFNPATADYYAAVREDSTKEVFVRRINDTTDILLYDFSLNEGDTFCFDFFNGICNVVWNIDSVLIGNSYRRMISVNSGEQQHWVEGIGNLFGLFDIQYTGSMLNQLLCFRQNDSLFVHYDALSLSIPGCHCDNGIGIDENKPQNITLFPNPASTQLTVQWAGSSTQCEVTIYNTQGQMVFNSTFDVRNSTPDSYRVDISSFPSGLYYLQLFDAKGALVKTEKVVKE